MFIEQAQEYRKIWNGLTKSLILVTLVIKSLGAHLLSFCELRYRQTRHHLSNY